MGGPAAGLLLAGLAVLASPARALLVSPARLPAIRHASGAACGLRMAADPEEPGGVSTEEKQRGSRKKGILWNRVRNRVRQDDLKRAPIGESVEVITKEIDQVLADRRKRLNVKLKTSLKRFRTEVSLAPSTPLPPSPPLSTPYPPPSAFSQALPHRGQPRLAPTLTLSTSPVSHPHRSPRPRPSPSPSPSPWAGHLRGRAASQRDQAHKTDRHNPP